MKHALRKVIAAILVLALNIAVFSFGTDAAAKYSNASKLRWVYGENDTLMASWDIDYSSLPSDVTVSGTLQICKMTEEYDMSLVNIRFSGKAKEIDVTEYARWYFADAEAWYYYNLTITYTTGSGASVNMPTIGSPSLLNNIFVLPDPKISQIDIPNPREGYDDLNIDIRWQNMKYGYILELFLSVNGRKILGMNAKPSRTDGAESTYRLTLHPSSDLPSTLKEGDVLGMEVRIMCEGEYIGGASSCQASVLPKTVRRDSGVLALIVICNPTGSTRRYDLAPGATDDNWRTIFNSASQWIQKQGGSGTVGYGAVYDNTVYYVNGRAATREAYEAADNGSAESLERRYDCVKYVYNKISALYGDVDRSGDVNIVDVTWLMRDLVGAETPLAQGDLLFGDVDGDGTIEGTEVTFIQRYLAGMDTPYPVGELIQY